MPSPILLLHICAAVVGLLSGATAMLFRKGSGLHGAAGSVFFVSMLVMTSSAAYVAVFERPNMLNAVVALLTFYLVSTAWRAARNRAGKTGSFDVAALLFILAVGLAGVTFGLEAAGSPKGSKDGMPPGIYFFFGITALLCGVTDIRMLRRGALDGSQRIARHLWRMSSALLITLMSFIPGNLRLLPESVRHSGVIYLPHLLLVGAMIYWRIRVRRRRRPRAEPLEPPLGLKAVA